MRKVRVIIISQVLFYLVIAQVSAAETKRTLTMFVAPACHKCAEIKQAVMPYIELEFADTVQVEYRDITLLENYKFLLSLQEIYGVKVKNTWPVFHLSGEFINGEGDVKANLEQLIKGKNTPPPVTGNNQPQIDLTKHFKTFSFYAVAGAGLVDGINPCAFTVIVFFMSFLALQGYRNRQLAAIGLAFIAAVFLTYLLLGAGVLTFLYRLRGFWLATTIFNYLVGFLSIGFGVAALYDFFKYSVTKQTGGLLLQLPAAVKNQIHAVIGKRYRKNGKERETAPIFKLIVSAFVTGFLVSLLEAVCTGQVYLPTIGFVLKSADLRVQALGYLLLYNVMFVVPLLAVFGLALCGANSRDFSGFFKKHLGLVKILMAILFFGLGGLLLWRG